MCLPFQDFLGIVDHMIPSLDPVFVHLRCLELLREGRFDNKVGFEVAVENVGE